MHNKFWIFDHRNGSPDGSDDWLMTGSYNVTEEGTYSDAQNVILFQDAALCTIYQAEFDQMWGSSTQTPDPTQSRFGANKQDVTPRRANVNGVPVEVYFSPTDGIMQAAIQQVQQADQWIYFCINTFTRTDLAGAMQAKYYGVPNFALRGVFDSSEGSDQYSVYANMKGIGPAPWNPPADVWLDQEAGTLHEKYMIVDASLHNANLTVITGSPNWSSDAENQNDENMIIVHDFGVADQYFQEFAMRYRYAGGTGNLVSGVSSPEPFRSTGWTLRATPNPAHGLLTLTYSAPSRATGSLRLFSPDGRLEATLYQGEFAAGSSHSLSFPVSDHGLALPAGIHFARLDAGQRQITARILIVR